MKKSFIEVNNSIFTVLRNYKKIKIIVLSKVGIYIYINISNVFDLVTKNLLGDIGFEETPNMNNFYDTLYPVICDMKVYHKKTKNNKPQINLYQLLKQIPKDLLSKVGALRIIVPADYFSRMTYKDIYDSGYDVSVVRLYMKN